MQSDRASNDESDQTHFWIYCPGCAYSGKIGVPHGYPADVVVCPSCRQVVSVKPEDRILWRPSEPTEFLKERFPHNDWEEAVEKNAPPPVVPTFAELDRNGMPTALKLLLGIVVAVCIFFALVAIVVISGQIYYGQFP